MNQIEHLEEQVEQARIAVVDAICACIAENDNAEIELKDLIELEETIRIAKLPCICPPSL